MKFVIIITLLLVMLVPAALMPLAARAQVDSGAGFQLVPKGCEKVGRDPGKKSEYGKITEPCEIKHIAKLFINVSNWILGIMGALALGFFVYGGFLWIIAAGNPEMIKKGQQVLIHTVVAIIIILLAFVVVRFIGEALGARDGEDRFFRYLNTSTSIPAK